MSGMESTTSVGITVQDPQDEKEEDDIPTVIEKATALRAIEVEAAHHTLEVPRIALLFSRASHWT
jgi:hypothetical protein